MAGLPVMATKRLAPTFSVIILHWSAVRWSLHKRAGRMTLSLLSRNTDPCICPVSPRPRGGSRSCETTPLSTAWLASHHRSGSCSVQPGRGVDSGYSSDAAATTLPSRSIATARAPLVPTSSPISEPAISESSSGIASDRNLGPPSVQDLLHPETGCDHLSPNG